MLLATWILAIATAVLAVEGGTALKDWRAHLRLGRRRREIDEIRQDIEKLKHAVWLSVAKAGQGTQVQIDERIRNFLLADGWQPDPATLESAGHFDMHRLRDTTFGPR